MGLWEELGRRHGLMSQSGFLLGSAAPGVADVVSATLWSTMTERFPAIGAILEDAAPMTANLARRVSRTPALVDLAARARRDYGDVYCGGQIEQSLRKVLGSKLIALAKGRIRLNLGPKPGEEIQDRRAAEGAARRIARRKR